MTIPGSATPLLLKAPAGGDGGEYTIERSVRFNSSDSAYLSRTPSTAGNRKTWTWAGWVKRSAPTTGYQALFSAGSNNFTIRFANDQIECYEFTGSYVWNYITTQVFRDYSAWYHFVLAVDTDNATAADRVKIYANGVRITAFSTATNPASGATSAVNNTNLHYIGTASTNTYLNGYLADCFLIDGQALDPTSFGEFDDNGIWQPIAYTGNYGLVSVADVTGALPIYNTTDTLGAVKGTGTRTDSNSSSIVLAIPMDGANNGTTFTDESATIKGSGSAKGITRNGDTKTSTAQSKYYGSSGYFDGTGDTLTLAASSDFAFGTNDFTIETWIYSEDISGSTQKGFFQLSDSSGGLNTNLNTGVAIYFGGGGYLTVKTGGITVISSLALSQNTWYHIAVTRSGDVHRLFVDGIERGTVTSSRSDITQQNVVVGGIYSTGYLYQGYLNDFRVYKGVAKYTSNFTIVTTNNSFHLPFSDNSTAAALGTDTSPNGNTWTVNNISVAAGAGNDSLVDVPQNGTETDTGLGGQVRGNYATLNPLTPGVTGLSNGNLDAASANAYPTIIPGSGSWYYEVDGTGYNWDGTIGDWTPRVGSHNFGQRPFSSTAPSGFKALNTANLPTGTITTSGTFTGNANADGPFVYLNGVPTAMTINGNSVTFATHADKLSNGFKIRTSSSSYNTAGSNTYSVSTTGANFKNARAQSNP